MLKVPEINQVVELEEMGGEEGRDEGDPDAEAFSGNQEAEVLEGNHEAGEAGEEGGGEQEAGEAGGEQEAGVAGGKLSGKNVSFAPDLST